MKALSAGWVAGWILGGLLILAVTRWGGERLLPVKGH